VRKWFWLAILRKGKLQWPRWYIAVLAIFLTGILAAGLVYAFVVFRTVSERGHASHVHAHSTR
jgi:cytoskeletal protein RodZ